MSASESSNRAGTEGADKATRRDTSHCEILDTPCHTSTVTVVHREGDAMSRSTNIRFGVVNHDALMSNVTATADRYGLTLSEFIRAGEEGSLVDDELRDLWLSVSAILTRLVS